MNNGKDSHGSCKRLWLKWLFLLPVDIYCASEEEEQSLQQFKASASTMTTDHVFSLNLKRVDCRLILQVTIKSLVILLSLIITWISWILDSDWSIQNTWHVVNPEQTDRCQGFMTVVKDAQICRKKSGRLNCIQFGWKRTPSCWSRSLRFASGSWSACRCSFPHNDRVAAHYPLLNAHTLSGLLNVDAPTSLWFLS